MSQALSSTKETVKDKHRGMVDLPGTYRGLSQVNHEDSLMECVGFKGPNKVSDSEGHAAQF